MKNGFANLLKYFNSYLSPPTFPTLEYKDKTQHLCTPIITLDTHFTSSDLPYPALTSYSHLCMHSVVYQLVKRLIPSTAWQLPAGRSSSSPCMPPGDVSRLPTRGCASSNLTLFSFFSLLATLLPTRCSGCPFTCFHLFDRVSHVGSWTGLDGSG